MSKIIDLRWNFVSFKVKSFCGRGNFFNSGALVFLIFCNYFSRYWIYRVNLFSPGWTKWGGGRLCWVDWGY